MEDAGLLLPARRRVDLLVNESTTNYLRQARDVVAGAGRCVGRPMSE